MGVGVTDIAIEDLEELLGSKGWAWLKAQHEKEWGPVAMMGHIRKIASEHQDLPLKTAKIDQALVAQAAVDGFLLLPAREIAKQREALHQRPDELAAMRRRGAGL